MQKWSHVIPDCVVSLESDPKNAKASYLLGVSYVREKQFEEGILSLQNALKYARQNEKYKRFLNEITDELQRARRENWMKCSTEKKEKLYVLNEKLKSCIQHSRERNLHTSEDSNSLHYEFDDVLVATEELCMNQLKNFETKEVPEYFMCPISMELMMDPVISPSGVSYERECIEMHLKKNTASDPLTRSPLSLDQLYPNIALKKAIDLYLDENPWAYEG